MDSAELVAGARSSLDVAPVGEKVGFETASRFESNLTPFDSLIPIYFEGHILNSIDT
jgi:hypothetical protein